MKINKQYIYTIIFCVILLASFTLWTHNWNMTKSDNYKEKLDHLNNTRDSLYMVNDSIQNVSKELNKSIDSLKSLNFSKDTIINKIEISYEKDFIDITNQSISSDAKFFSDYLSQDSSRFSNSNNSSAIKTY